MSLEPHQRVWIRGLMVLALCSYGCVLDNQGSPDAAVYDVADGAPYPGFRDASPCGGGTSGTSGTSGTIFHESGTSGGDCTDNSGTTPTKPVDAAPPDATPCDYATFSYESASAVSVWVTGDFTSWGDSPVNGAKQMTKVGTTWSWSGQIGAGRHLYKFIVDNAAPWIADPSNPNQEADGLGGWNSVIEVCTNVP